MLWYIRRHQPRVYVQKQPQSAIRDNMMKILLILFASAAIFHKNAAQDDAFGSVVDGIRKVLQKLETGATGEELTPALNEIVVIIDGILSNSNVQVDMSKVQAVFATLMQQEHVEDVNGVTRSFALLKYLADILETKLDSADQQAVYDVLSTTREILHELITYVSNLGSGITYTYSHTDAVRVASARRVRGQPGQEYLNRSRRCWAICFG